MSFLKPLWSLTVVKPLCRKMTKVENYSGTMWLRMVVLCNEIVPLWDNAWDCVARQFSISSIISPSRWLAMTPPPVHHLIKGHKPQIWHQIFLFRGSQGQSEMNTKAIVTLIFCQRFTSNYHVFFVPPVSFFPSYNVSCLSVLLQLSCVYCVSELRLRVFRTLVSPMSPAVPTVSPFSSVSPVSPQIWSKCEISLKLIYLMTNSKSCVFFYLLQISFAIRLEVIWLHIALRMAGWQTKS